MDDQKDQRWFLIKQLERELAQKREELNTFAEKEYNKSGRIDSLAQSDVLANFEEISETFINAIDQLAVESDDEKKEIDELSKKDEMNEDE